MERMVSKLSSRDQKRRQMPSIEMSPTSTSSSIQRRMSFTLKLDPNALVEKYLRLNVNPTQGNKESERGNTSRGQKTESDSFSLRTTARDNNHKHNLKKEITIQEARSSQLSKDKPATSHALVKKTYYGSLISKINPKILQLDSNQKALDR